MPYEHTTRITSRTESKIQSSKTENGVTTYYTNGMVSRLDGPAIMYDDNREDEYWLDGMKTDKQTIEKLQREKEDAKMHTIHIDGVNREVSGKTLRELRRIIG